MDISFIKSERFYFNLIGSVGVWLKSPDPFTTPGIGTLLIAIAGIFLGINTTDRVLKKFTTKK